MIKKVIEQNDNNEVMLDSVNTERFLYISKYKNKFLLLCEVSSFQWIDLTSGKVHSTPEGRTLFSSSIYAIRSLIDRGADIYQVESFNEMKKFF